MLDLDRLPSANPAVAPAVDDRAEPAVGSDAPHARHARNGHPHSHRRHVPSTLSLRRLLVVSALVLLLPALLIAAVLLGTQPGPAPSETAPGFSALAQIPNGLLRAQLDRSQQVSRLIKKLTGPRCSPRPKPAAPTPVRCPPSR